MNEKERLIRAVLDAAANEGPPPGELVTLIADSLTDLNRIAEALETIAAALSRPDRDVPNGYRG